MRGMIAGGVLGALAAAPVAALLLAGIGPGELLAATHTGLLAEIESVGWVLVPQLVLAVGILGLALQQLARAAAGLPRLAAPGWISPAVESALLLGLLGTISGMVAGFAGVSPDALEPAPLVRGLGAALRSTFVGFAIALVGVWLKDDSPVELVTPTPLPTTEVELVEESSPLEQETRGRAQRDRSAQNRAQRDRSTQGRAQRDRSTGSEDEASSADRPGSAVS